MVKGVNVTPLLAIACAGVLVFSFVIVSGPTKEEKSETPRFFKDFSVAVNAATQEQLPRDDEDVVILNARGAKHIYRFDCPRDEVPIYDGRYIVKYSTLNDIEVFRGEEQVEVKFQKWEGIKEDLKDAYLFVPDRPEPKKVTHFLGTDKP